MDPWRAPQRVLAAHPPNQRSNLGINPRTAADVAGLPVPVGAEPASMPADHGLRLYDDDRVQQRRVQSIQPHRQQAIDAPQSHACRGSAPQHCQLLAQDEILCLKPHSPREPRPDSNQQPDQKREHSAALPCAHPRVILDKVFGRHRRYRSSRTRCHRSKKSD